jgi:hypothetical protein
LLWADAFYLRDLLSENVDPALKTPDNLLKLACIADILHFPDYTIELLEYLTTNFHSDPNYNFADCIVEALSNIPDLASIDLSSLALISNIREYMSERGEELLASDK